MSWRICCGVSFVLCAVILAILTLLLNIFIGSGFRCEDGSFPCKRYSVGVDLIINSTKGYPLADQASEHSVGSQSASEADVCLPQRFFCDGTPHCPQGEDESLVTCADLSGSMLLNTIISSKRNLSDYAACQITDYPDECFCAHGTRLICEGLDRIPDQVTPNVKRMILSDNSIRVLPSKAFSRYNLELIHLDGNGLIDIEAGAFSEQKNLEKLFLRRNELVTLKPGVFVGLSNLKWLLLSNNHLKKLSLHHWGDLQSLQWLFLSSNELSLEGESFPLISSHIEVFLKSNQISRIGRDTFQGLRGLMLLDLKYNKIQSIHEDAFQGNSLLAELDLSNNHLTVLPGAVFSGLHNLSKLLLGYNNELEINTGIFGDLWSLSSLNLQGVEVENLDTEMFSNLSKLEFIYFKSFYYCTYAPKVPKCKPNSDGVSSREHLLVRPVLQISLWLVASVTCIGNIIVLFGRQILLSPSINMLQTHLSNSFPSLPVMLRHSHPEDKQNHTPSLFIQNLAASDLLMGFYLCVIGMKDIAFRGIFHTKAREWMASWTCSLIGILAMTSSEVSVLILTCMSIERFVVIASAFSRPWRPATQTAKFTLATIWALGFTLAIFPAIHWHHGASQFYGTNGMCLPLHLHDSLFRPGWQYSAFIFLGINVTAMLLIAFSYGGMLISIMHTRHLVSASNSLSLHSPADLHLALRFLFIVLTDALCWAPVAALKAASLFGNEISADVYGWLVVFILPINSAFNPLIYTFTAPSSQSCSLMRLVLLWLRGIVNVNRSRSRRDKSHTLKYQLRPFAVENMNEDSIGRAGINIITDCSDSSTPSAKRSLKANDPISFGK